MSKHINLYTENMQKLFLRVEKLEDLKRDLENILEIADMNSLSFSKRSLFSEEIKTNNLVEGYDDDIEYIEDVVKNNQRRKNADNEKEQRILNLYNGYKYILSDKEINLDNLSTLYKMLSRNLLKQSDLERMGKYFREAPVYIYPSSIISQEPHTGMSEDKVPFFMQQLLEYINTPENFESQTDYYIKSQIIHFYFVHVHPYFDVNGRTSRTLALWYLLNNKIYPYIIFNRGINLDKRTYEIAIQEAEKFGNVTIFVKYMLENVKKELEKEYAILEIEKNSSELSNIERQCINYILSMKGNITIKDFAQYYKNFNEKRRADDLLESVIEPLIDKKIVIPGRVTSTYINSDTLNYFFELNDDLLTDYNRLVKKK